MNAFITGAFIGAGIGLLLAPRRGQETREQLRQRVQDAGERLNTRAEEWAERIPGGERVLGKVRETASSASRLANEAMERMPSVLRGQDSFLKALNSMDRERLLTIEGIGPVTADRILEGRPYRDLEDFRGRKLVPQNIFEELQRVFNKAA